MSTARSRARNYRPQITKVADGGTATNSQAALKAAVSYILTELKQLAEHRSEDAEEARWHAADQIGNLAEALPKFRRPGTERKGRIPDA